MASRVGSNKSLFSTKKIQKKSEIKFQNARQCQYYVVDESRGMQDMRAY